MFDGNDLGSNQRIRALLQGLLGARSLLERENEVNAEKMLFLFRNFVSVCLSWFALPPWFSSCNGAVQESPFLRCLLAPKHQACFTQT